MKKKPIFFLWILFIGAKTLTWTDADAALGESVASIEKDRSALSPDTAVRRKTRNSRSNYTIYEINSESSVIREYVSPSGVIFGLAWTGIRHPDLTQILGTYFTEYQEASRKNPRLQGRRNLTVKTNRVVVQKWGHMRKLQGRAYDASLLPEGVQPSDIQ